ncbi:hypothetical protein [Nocardia grenadensis]|uniref:hypothetical protein n=1 Tax=Nocardia grenadensis TaxID=931537 RepID=UPI003D7524A8
MTAYFDESSPPQLSDDGETILLPLRGRTADGIYYRGVEELHPGEPGYDDLLPIARANPVSAEEDPQRPVDPDTMARILRDTGLDRPDAPDS